MDKLEIRPNVPEFVLPEDYTNFQKHDDPNPAVKKLLDGQYIIISDQFYDGLKILNVLKKKLKKKIHTQSFAGQRAYRAAYRNASHNLLLEFEENRAKVKKAPKIGWLKRFYSTRDYVLSFPDVQGLNSSWQWYTKGIRIPPANINLYPFYGVYFPTRYNHIILFHEWLKSYSGKQELAIDIGVGSGILALDMVKQGFEKVIGTDINPNAIIGMVEERERQDLTPESLELVYGDLFSTIDEQADIVTFNPPWLEAQHKITSGIDQAIYYKKDLFHRFFSQVSKHLKPSGKIVLLFSNLAQIVHNKRKNPILAEIEQNNRFVVAEQLNFHSQAASKKTRRRTRRKQEQVELWVLEKKS